MQPIKILSPVLILIEIFPNSSEIRNTSWARPYQHCKFQLQLPEALGEAANVCVCK